MGGGLFALSGVVVALVAAPVALADASLPDVPSGHRPGPDILYAPAPRAPQLESTGVWRAPPILVSGATAYRDGEFLYQDYLYDDHGAAGVPDQGGATYEANNAFAPPEGTYSYPTDPVYANNAADLVEVRVKPLAGATAFRVTLNTLIDPARVAFTLALGSSPAAVPWPHGANVTSPAQLFVTVHGHAADVLDAATGASRSPSPSVTVDLARRQFEVTVPHAAWDPGRSRVRLAAGAGLWDAAAGGYLAPQPAASATAPGGAGPAGAALVNLAFRSGEPWPDPEVHDQAWTLADGAATFKADGAWWRERAQADALRTGDVSGFSADVDFAKLAARKDDESGVPRSGWIDRIFPSHFSFGQGVDLTKTCPRFPSSCEGVLRGQLQTYALYVPARPAPPRGRGMTLLLHALNANHNLYTGARLGPQLGDRGPGSLVLTPGDRGLDGDYTDYTEADVFEAWADVARHYRIDPDWTAVGGFSMGGGGAYKLSERWPDLFARAWGMGASTKDQGTQAQWLPALRNVPVMTWVGDADEGTTPADSQSSISALGAAGLRFVYDQFATADHATIFENDEYGPVADFLGEHRVDRDPAHVSYVIDGRSDFAHAGVVADHAYWLSGLRVRDPQAGPAASVDARSEGFGAGDPKPLGTQLSTGVLEGGRKAPLAYQRSAQDWSPAPAAPRADRLIFTATNLASAVVDMRRARLSCHARLDVKTDGPLALTLAGCGTTRRFTS